MVSSPVGDRPCGICRTDNLYRVAHPAWPYIVAHGMHPALNICQALQCSGLQKTFVFLLVQVSSHMFWKGTIYWTL